jgi:hypothetical protein
MLVEKLSLPTRKHSNTYHIQWLNDGGKIRVSRSVRIPFFIGAYSDYVDCDVVPMEACSLLLGRPWQYDIDSLHHGRSNHYSLMFKGQKIIIHPMTPEQIVKDEFARAVKTAKEQEPSPSTSDKSEIKLNAPVLLAIGADFDDIRDANLPCYALVCSSVLVSLDDAPSLDISPAVASLLQEYADVFPKDLPPGLPPLRGIKHQSTSFPAPNIQTALRTVQTRMRQKRFSARCRHCLIRVTFVSLLALAQFLCYLFLRKMVHGVCASTVVLLITSPFVIDTLYHALMIC